MQVIFFCRFSYPAQGGFQVEHDSLAARLAYLYDTARLAARMQVFEHLCLPALRAQSDADFTLVLLVGTCLPEPFREHLEALLSDMPQARIVARDPGPHRKICQQVLNAMRDDMGAPCLQVRHDDDDAVAVDFVETLRRTAGRAGPLFGDARLWGLDWNRGFAIRGGAKTGLEVAPMTAPYLGVAQAIRVAGGARLGAMNFAHGRIHRFMPTATFNDPPMFLRGITGRNDSRQKPRAAALPFERPSPEVRAMLARRFALTADAARRAFSEPDLF